MRRWLLAWMLWVVPHHAWAASIVSLTDVQGFVWDIWDDSGAIDNGKDDAYDRWPWLCVSTNRLSSEQCSATEVYQPTGSTSWEMSNRQLVLPMATLAGLQVQRKVYVPNTGTRGFARFQEILTNNTSSPIAVMVRVGMVQNPAPGTTDLSLGSENCTQITGDSDDSDGTIILKDNLTWFSTDDSDTNSGDLRCSPGEWSPSLGHVVAFPQPLIAMVSPGQGAYGGGGDRDQLRWEYRNLRIQPGQRVIILHFETQQGGRPPDQNNSAADKVLVNNACTGLVGLPAEAINGMTQDELDAVVNAPNVMANANGPYSGAEDANIGLTATGTRTTTGAISLYEWDCTSDGTYDQATTTVTSSCRYSWPGTHTIMLRVTTTTNRIAYARATVVVSEVNDLPVPQNDSVIINEDAQTTWPTTTFTGNDAPGPSDESGQTLTITSVTSPSAQGGVVQLVGGEIRYTPAANYSGMDSFTYTVGDNGTTNGAPDPRTAVGAVTVTVLPVNDPPEAGADTLNANEDVLLDVPASDLLRNDNPGAGESNQTLAVISVSAPNQAGASLTLESGRIRYTPPLDFNGTDSFTYVVQDTGSSGGAADPKTATGSVTVLVAEVNDPPTAVDDTASAYEDITAYFNESLLVANDSRGPANEASQSLHVISVSPSSTAGGTVSVWNGRITYAPPDGFSGADTFTYVVQDDGRSGTSSAPKTDEGMVTVNVTGINDPPLPQPDTVYVDEDTHLTFPTSMVTDNDAAGPPSESGQALTVTSVSAVSQQQGTVELNNGSITYTPPADFTGTDSFTYVVTDDGTTDGVADPQQATGTVTLVVVERNDSPVAQDDAKSTTKGRTLAFSTADLLQNDSAGPANESQQQLFVVAASTPSQEGGAVDLSGSTITYTPPAGFVGTDRFTYGIRDDGTTDGQPDPKTASATVSITVTEGNEPPTAVADAYDVDEDTELVVPVPGVLGNDTDGDSAVITARVTEQPASGTLVLNANGSFTYTPNADFYGQDGFSYVANDATSDSTAASVIITVNPINDVPVAVDDGYHALPGQNLVVPAPGVLANDVDKDGDALTVELVADVEPAQGQLELNADGTFTFMPAAGFLGNASFTYRVKDPQAAVSNTATVIVAVDAENDPPQATDDMAQTNEDTPLVLRPLANDTDPELDVLAPVEVSTPAHGSVAVNVDGTITYSPAQDYWGPDSFTYEASDGTLVSNSATVSITVTSVNDAPAAQSVEVDVPFDTATSITLAGTDVDGDPIGFTVKVAPGHGRLSGFPPSVTYTPEQGYMGEDSFGFSVHDEALESPTATITLHVLTPDGGRMDAGSSDGSIQVDDASVVEDACVVMEDGGSSGDGGVDPLDAATVVDASVVTGDAGGRKDSGTPWVPDGGGLVALEDAGVEEEDGGTTQCACVQSPASDRDPSWMLWAAVLLLGARIIGRRRPG